MPIPDAPYTRKEAYLNAIATGSASGIPETPYTREEMYLDAIARGGGGGSSTLSGLTDVDISNPTDGQTLVYNAASGKWENGAGGGGGFTLLHGTYSMVEETETITLPITASELYALIRTTTVAFDYTVGGGGVSSTNVLTVTFASITEETGYANTYSFYANDILTGVLEATDSVVFRSSEK